MDDDETTVTDSIFLHEWIEVLTVFYFVCREVWLET